MADLVPESAATSPAGSSGTRFRLELAALAGLAVAVVSVVQAWPRLPDVVSMHFDLAGRPDGWGSRKSVLLLPATSLFLYVLLTAVERLPPHWYNYPVGITEENRARQHRLARDLVLWMKALLMGLFAHLTVLILRTAFGEAAGLGPWTIFLWLGVIFGLVGVYLARALRAR